MRTAIIAICFIVGICLTANEGAWWPWINFVGIGIFFMVPVLARKWRYA